MSEESSDRGPPNVSGGQVVRLPLKPKGAAESVSTLVGAPEGMTSAELAAAYERFQVQVALDVENERELLYKSLLVVEVIALLFALRELLLQSLL
jgi:hypothetical protein